MNRTLLLSLFALPPLAAAAQAPVPPRLMVMVDTSGSMVWHFGNNTSCGGDGDAASRYTDINQTNKNFYPGAIITGQPDGVNSRLYAAKASLFSGLSATGDYIPGLMRYHVNAGCPNLTNCCNFNAPGCATNTDYIDNTGKINWAGDCGPIDGGGNASDGGQLLVLPTQANAAPIALSWVDNVEDFRTGGVNGFPLNPELRAAGNTPLAGVVRTALNNWYNPVFIASNGGNCLPSNPLCDTQINCRPYHLVLITDGADTCDADPVNNPPAAVTQLHGRNGANPVLTDVIGVAFIAGDPAINVLNAMAANGGTGQARIVASKAELDAALAAIIADSFKSESCNGADDNCNGAVDEGFGVYQECADPAACASGTCNQGRCTCANSAQCAAGMSCAAGFCAPACGVGVGACQRSGVRKCSAPLATACCVNDGLAACTPLVPGNPQAEICGNGVDDNCDGRVDESPPC